MHRQGILVSYHHFTIWPLDTGRNYAAARDSVDGFNLKIHSAI